MYIIVRPYISSLPVLTCSLAFCDQYGEDRLLWTAASQPLPPSLASSPGQPATTIQIPFSFQLPPVQMNLPPSFEGGQYARQRDRESGSDCG